MIYTFYAAENRVLQLGIATAGAPPHGEPPSWRLREGRAPSRPFVEAASLRRQGRPIAGKRRKGSATCTNEPATCTNEPATCKNEPATCTKWACHLHKWVCHYAKWQTRFGLFRLWVDIRSEKVLNPHRRNLQNWEYRCLRGVRTGCARQNCSALDQALNHSPPHGNPSSGRLPWGKRRLAALRQRRDRNR